MAFISLFIYKVAKRVVTDHVLEYNAMHTKAVIINERNYEPNQPVRAGFTYSYQFKINNILFTGNSHDESVKVGDSVEVEYSEGNPNLNRSLHSKE